jgi:hydrogenase maturation factor
VHVESVSILLADGIQLPPLLAGVVIAYVLVLLPVPVIDVAFLPSQLALQSVQAPQSPMQLIGQFVIVHVESVSILLADGIQLPPLLAGVVIAYVLVLLPVPVIDVAFLPSQLALQSVQASQFPLQLIGQFVLVHVESVSIVLSDIVQAAPP